MTADTATTTRHRKISNTWRALLVIASSLAILVTIKEVFYIYVFGIQLTNITFLYLLFACYFSFVFILYPYSKKASSEKIPWYDYILFTLSVLCSSYIASQGYQMQLKGYGYAFAPTLITICSVILWLIVVEGGRRISGTATAIVCAFFSLYPTFAMVLPGPFKGINYNLLTTARFHAISYDSIMGVPMRMAGTLLLGFMIFGAILQHLGAGEFLLKMGFSLFGKSRGGPAKVAIVISALFGSMSGSPVANVIATGSMTIPAMIKRGYPPYYAAAVETCASTGGCMMPPIMGSVAFVMAGMLGVPYTTIALAAAIPSLLYYLGLYIQVDGRAAKLGLQGVPESEIGSMRKILKEGWFYIFGFLLLIYFLVVLRVTSWAPYFASLALLVLSMIRKETRVNWKKLYDLMYEIAKIMVEVIAILVAVGLIIGGLSITGVALSFSHEVVRISGGNVYIILAMGALASLVLGMGMTVTACYIFLAIVMAPGLIAAGLNPIAVHLFIMYYGMLSYITPPVALAASTASGLAQANFVKVGLQSMRLGAVIYIIPIFFVLNPALVLQNSTFLEIAWVLFRAFIGVFAIASALEGYLLGAGSLLQARFSLLLRTFLGVIGLIITMPTTPWQFDLTGVAALIILTLVIRNMTRYKGADSVLPSASKK